MIAVQIILFAIGALLADANECSCRCNKQDVCDEQDALRTKLDNSTDEIQKWNRYYNFVKGLSEDWEYQVDHFMRQQLEVEVNGTVEGLRNASQKIVSKHKEDMMARMESFENSVRALLEEADVLDLTMAMLSDEMRGIRTEFRRIQYGRKCGIDFDNGGRNTSNGLVWPWMAAVSDSDSEYRCGGSVIHRHFVLTSAMCVNLFGRDRLTVKLGFRDLKKGTHRQQRRVESTHVHPQFKTGPRFDDINRDYDIGLLVLKEPIRFGQFVRPICLPPRDIPQDEPFYKPQSTVQAHRLIEFLSAPRTAPSSTVLNPVLNLTILPQDDCRRLIEEDSLENEFPSPDHHFCSEGSFNRCLYTGSPLMESRLEGDGTRTWTQVGIRSMYSTRCKYFISPRLDRLRAWVDDTIKDSSKV